MDVKQPFHTSNDPRWLLIARVISSNHFRSSLRLREFLLYIADCAVKETPEAATEQQIGVNVFHRPPGYNSSEDSIVRTHARLLRQKLTDYFATEGSAEPTIVEVPKGHYLPIFRLRQSDPPPAPFPVPLEAKTISDYRSSACRGKPLELSEVDTAGDRFRDSFGADRGWLVVAACADLAKAGRRENADRNFLGALFIRRSAGGDLQQCSIFRGFEDGPAIRTCRDDPTNNRWWTTTPGSAN